MNIQYFLDAIDAARTQFEQWGITTESLIAIAALALICFMLSLREVLSWFLKVQHLRDDVKTLKAQNAVLEKMMHELYGLVNERTLRLVQTGYGEAEDDEDESAAKSAAARAEAATVAPAQPAGATPRFPLDH